MRFFSKLGMYRRLFGRIRDRNRLDLDRLLRKRPPILAGVAAYELALLAANRVDTRLKTLGAIKVSSLVGCPF